MDPWFSLAVSSNVSSTPTGALAVDKRKYFEKIGYHPHPGQDRFHDALERFRIATCGRRYGKSTMAAKDVQPELLVPNKLFWIVGPTYDLGEKEFRIIWNDMIRNSGYGADRRIKKTYNRRSGVMYIEFPWNSRIEVRSADHPENLVGDALDGVIMAEAAKHRRDTWEQFIRPSLADKRGWATFCTTPEGHNWLFDLYMLGQNPNFEDYKSWRMPSWDNTAVYPDGYNDKEIQLLKATMSPEWFQQEIGAEFTSFVGKIYSEFDERIHVRPHTYNPRWLNFNFWDWGFVNPLAMLDVQIDPFDNIYIWREHYEANLRLEDHIEQLRERSNPDEYKVECSYADSADQEAVMTVNVKYGPCIALDEAKQNWRQGIEVVKRFLRTEPTGLLDDYGDPIMRSKLYIDPSCTNTIKEFMNYKMAEPPRTGKSDAQEKPLKKNDHAMDALRYGLVHIYELGANYHLEDTMGSPSRAERGSVNREDDVVTMSLGSPTSGLFTKSKDF